VGGEILNWIPPQVQRIYVGKETGKNPPVDTGRLLARAAREGKAVVRLKGGDPNLFGRGGDEMLALLEEGIEFEVVPGVTSLTAVPAAAGIPVTFRGLSHQVVVRSGYRKPEQPCPRLSPSPPAETTYVYFMIVGRLTEIVVELLQEDNLPPSTPVAIIQRGTLPDQCTLVGTLENILEQTDRVPLHPPALVIAGEVVRFADHKTLMGFLSEQGLVAVEAHEAKGSRVQ
jgi:uroporphyrinogen III methyltransferase/synthase